MGSDGEWLMAHQVALGEPLRGRLKLVRMLGMAIEECLAPIERPVPTMPLLLCLREHDRPGRLTGLDQSLVTELETTVGVAFDVARSSLIPQGRPSVLLAAAEACRLIREGAVENVLIGAVDSLLVNATLTALQTDGRLLRPRNSDAFIPGEAAGALLLRRHSSRVGSLICEGFGVGVEVSTIASDKPLRANGLTTAIQSALADAGCAMHDVDFRITDNSGEQYYFKESALALSRTLRRRKEAFEIWHPADCVGEVGAAAGAVAMAVALEACRKNYSPGRCILIHAGTDAGQRVAGVFRFVEGF